jgi:hypothetical protein
MELSELLSKCSAPILKEREREFVQLVFGWCVEMEKIRYRERENHVLIREMEIKT